MKKEVKLIKSIAIIFLYFIINTFLSIVLKNYLKSSNFWISYLSAISVSLISMIILYLIFRKNFNQDFIKFRKNYRNYLKIGIKNWIIGLLLMVIVNNILIYVLGGIALNEEQNREILKKLPLYAGIVMIFIGPFCEETIFRLNLKNIFNKWYTYAITSGLLFGLAHVLGTTGKEFLFFIPYSILGFYFAKTYYETDNIFTSITIHSLHNAIAILMIILTGAF
jgi:membrane protease YdiL (CAAX protease family)